MRTEVIYSATPWQVIDIMHKEGFIPREVNQYFDRFRSSKNGGWAKGLENRNNLEIIDQINDYTVKVPKADDHKVEGHKVEGHKTKDFMVNDYFDLACYIAYQVNNGGDGFTLYERSKGSHVSYHKNDKPYYGRLNYAAQEIFRTSNVFKNFDQKTSNIYKTYVITNYIIEQHFPKAEQPLKMSLDFSLI